MKRTKSILIIWLVSLNFTLLAQGIKIQGTVTDKNTGEPLPGVAIIVNGTTIGTITNYEGKYQIYNVPEDAKLTFSFVGMQTQEIEVGNQNTINVSLEPKTIGIEEVIAIGYGSLNKKEVSSAITNVTKSEFIQGAVKSPMDLIVGKVAGLNINSTAPANPNSSPSLQIRGATSLTAGNNPLIVINDIPGGSIESIAPQDIESITVLKDGASAAIYGTRGANGVILINTKQGSTGAGRTSVNYDSWFGMSILKDIPRVLSADEFIKARLGRIDYGGNTDWYKAILNDFVYDNNQYVNFSGSMQNSWYNASLNYKNSKGMEIGNERLEYGGRFEMMQKALNGLVEFTGSLNLRKIKADKRGADFGAIITRNPTIPIYNNDGSYYHTNDDITRPNPVEYVNESTNYSDQLYIRASSGLKINLIQKDYQNLSSSISILYEQNEYDDQSYSPSSITLLFNDFKGLAYLSNSLVINRSFDWLLNYLLDLDNNKIKVVAGYSYQDFLNSQRSMSNRDFAYDDFLWNNIGSGSYLPAGNASMSSNKSLSKLIALFGRVNYNWKDFIYASASLRYEGSTKFGANNKWGYFPAASIAWELANINIIKSNLHNFNSLKIRASLGVTGRSGFSPYQSIPTYSSNGYYFMDDSWINAFEPSRNPNPDLRWEKGINLNYGLDFSLCEGRFSGSIDYFNRKSKDLLYTYNAPQPPMVYNSILVNVGTIVNKGIEVSVNGDILKGNHFDWSSGINFSTGKTHLKSLSNDVYGASNLDMYNNPTRGSTEYLFRYEEGGEIGRFYTYRHAGVSDDGQLMIYNKDGDVILKGQEQPNDKDYTGSGVPKAFISWNNTFRYEKFDLNIFITGAFDFDILSLVDYDMGFIASDTDNVFLKAYTKRVNITGDPRILSSFHLHDGSYMKLENITLGYTATFKNNYIDKLRVFTTARNLYTFTSYEGHDPSAVNVNGLVPGIDKNGAYPSAVQLSLGITINF